MAWPGPLMAVVVGARRKEGSDVPSIKPVRTHYEAERPSYTLWNTGVPGND